MLTNDLENAGHGFRYTLYESTALYEKCIGFCWYHHKWLTVGQLKKHECLGKQCNALEKRPHVYWDQREKKRQMKKARKK